MSKTPTAPITANNTAPSNDAGSDHAAHKESVDKHATTELIRSQIDTIFGGGAPQAADLSTAQPALTQTPATINTAEPVVTTNESEPANVTDSKAPTAPDPATNPYNRTHTTNFDLGQYHSAWQKYYQEYYQRYYEQQLATAKMQVGQAATSAIRQDAAIDQPDQTNKARKSKNKPDPSSNITASSDTSRLIKSDILATVRSRIGKVRKSSHFIPAISGILVVSLFLFLQYNRVMVANVKAYVSPGSLISESDTILVDPTATSTVTAEPKLIIPKVNVNVPVVYDEPSMQDADIQKALERGVVRYNLAGANALPGQVGNLVIGGHSTNDVFDTGGYKFAFLLIDRLQAGDIFYIHYQSTRYIYRVTEKKVIMPSEIEALQINNGKPMATLVTCTPTGTALKRLLVFGEQISPDPAAAQTATQPTTNSPTVKTGLPGNSPTLFDRLTDLIL